VLSADLAAEHHWCPAGSGPMETAKPARVDLTLADKRPMAEDRLGRLHRRLSVRPLP
jgi:hypothetical protein